MGAPKKGSPARVGGRLSEAQVVQQVVQEDRSWYVSMQQVSGHSCKTNSVPGLLFTAFLE